MSRILYQKLTEPVLPPTLRPETVTESRWHQALAEPVRRVGLITACVAASCLCGPPFVPDPVPPPPVSGWHGQISQPQTRDFLSGRQATAQTGGLTAPPYVPDPVPVPRVPSWHEQISQPQSQDFLSGDYATVKAASGLTAPPYVPNPIPPPSIGWLRALSEPTRKTVEVASKPTLSFVFAPASAETITVDKWFSAFTQPRPSPDKTALQAAQSVIPNTPITGAGDVLFATVNTIVPYSTTLLYQSIADAVRIPESVTADRWVQPLSQPILRKPLQAQYLFYVEAAPFSEAVSIDKWQQPLSEPKRFPRALDYFNQPYLTFVEAAPFAESVTADRWVQPFSEPVRIRGTPATQQQAFFIGTSDAVNNRWFAPLSEPVRTRLGLPAYQQNYFSFVKATPFAETVSADRWFQPFPGPQQPRRVSEFPALTWSGFTPASTEVVTVDKWYAWLREPVRARLGLAAHLQPYLSFVKAAPFTETVSIDKWLRALSEPTRRQSPAPDFWASNLSAPETVTVDKWFEPFTGPVRVPRPAADYPTLTWSYFTPPPLPPPGGGKKPPGSYEERPPIKKPVWPIWDKRRYEEEQRRLAALALQVVQPPPQEIFRGPPRIITPAGLPTFREYAPQDPAGIARQMREAAELGEASSAIRAMQAAQVGQEDDESDALEALRAMGIIIGG